MAKFKRGDRVVCINDNFTNLTRMPHDYSSVKFPKRGQAYTVRGYITGGRKPCLVVREIKNGSVVYSNNRLAEASFWEERFEKLPETDISTFTKIAADIGQWMKPTGPEQKPRRVRRRKREDA